MRKERFSKYVKRLALLTEHQRVLLGRALVACTHGEGAMVCRVTDVTPAAEPAIR